MKFFGNYYLNEVAQIEVNKITNWLDVNKLSLNIAKTKFILFRQKKTALIQLKVVNLISPGSEISSIWEVARVARGST